MNLLEFSIGATLTAEHRLMFDRRVYWHQLRRMKPGRKTVTITSGEKRSKTYQQVKYWWAVPVELCADHCGYTPAQMNTALLGECFGYVDGPTGHAVPAKPSLADLSVEEANHLIDWVLIWAPSQLDVTVPEPDKDWWKKRRAS